LQLMDELKREKIKIAIGSASKNAQTIIDQIKIESYLEAIVDGKKISRAKPDPEIFLMAAKELKVSPENCIVFEDAWSGIQAANNAGMTSIGVSDKKNLSEANYVIKGLHEINLSILKNIFYKK